MRGPCSSSFVSDAQGARHACPANRPLARSRVARGVLVCLFALIPLRAAEAWPGLTSRAGRPGTTSQGWYGFEISPTFSLPVPAGSANRDEIGLDAGLSFTAKTSPNLGIGGDAAYHYWPVSAEFKRRFNEVLGERTLNTLMLGGGTWGLRVVQLGVHFRIETSTTRSVRPWIQVGGGAYRVDPRTTGYSGEAGFFRVVAPPLKTTQHFGASVAVGTDLLGGPPARMGLHATYHFVNCKERIGGDLHVFTLGAQAHFGR